MSAAEKQMGTFEQYQLKLEELYDKHQLMPRVRKYFKDKRDIPFLEFMRKLGIPEDFGWDMLAQIAVHKRCDVPTMVSCLRRHCETAQEVADILERAVRANFLMFQDGTFIVAYEIPPDLQRELDMFQYPLPMVVEPRELVDNLSTGYLRGKGSVILRDNHHDRDVCLDHLNRMNKVALSLNVDVARSIQNKWRGLDKKKEDETWDDFQQRQKAFDKYCKVADHVIDIMVNAGNSFYLTYKYDKRGRSYPQGHHINPQGTDWNKAVIELSDKEQIEE